MRFMILVKATKQSEKGMEHREWSPGEGANSSFGFQAN